MDNRTCGAATKFVVEIVGYPLKLCSASSKQRLLNVRRALLLDLLFQFVQWPPHMEVEQFICLDEAKRRSVRVEFALQFLKRATEARKDNLVSLVPGGSSFHLD